MGLAVIFCSALSAQSWDPTATVFVDGTVLYGTSENGVLRADLETGAITLVDANGGVQEFQSPYSSVDRTIEADSLGLRFIAGPLAQRGASCSSQASALQSAISTVQSACANGPSTSCTSATTAMHDAYDAYASCLRTSQQQY